MIHVMRLTTALVLVVAAASALAAQTQKPAALSGEVRDLTGRPIPGVEVVVADGSGGERRAQTGIDGRYEFASLGPGRYSLSATLPGFIVFRSPLFYDGRAPMRRDIPLSIGMISEEVTVRAPAATADSASAAGADESRRSESAGRERPPCKAGKTGGEIVEPRKIFDMRPIYPLDLVASKESGTVVLTGIVMKDGAVGSIRAVKDPHANLTAAAIEAVSKWRFTPTLLNCDPIEVGIQVTVNFTLGG